MSDKAPAIPAKTTRSDLLAMAVPALLLVAVIVAIAAAAPYVFKGATLEGEVAEQLRASTGLRIVTSAHARFGLLPAPHISMSDVKLASPDAGLVVDAGALKGDVRLLPLVVGRLELASATLTRPKLSIDLDAGGMRADSTIGRALQGLAPEPGDAGARLGTVTLVDGTAVLTSKDIAHLPRLEGINATVDWPDIASPATLTGSLVVDGTATDIAAWVAQPSSLMRGETSPIALRIRGAPLELSANGDLASTGTRSFRGHVALTAPSLSALMARLGNPVPHLAPLANATLTSDTTVTLERSGALNVDLPGLSLDLDGNHYEGTLAYASGSKPSLSGTLATDTLTLAPFLAAEPNLADAEHHWTRTALVAGSAEAIDLDLRISASHLRIAPFTIDDAAVSVMTRGARTEVALNGGTAYGGRIKAHASIGDQAGIVSVRGAGTLADADMAGLSWDALGRQVAAGTVSGALNLETSGNSAATLMAHLQGWAKLRASDGEISGIDLGRGLRDVGDGGRFGAGLVALRRGQTPFSSTTVSLHLSDGIATIEEANLHGPDATVAMTGTADIAARRLSLDATATLPDSQDRDRLAAAITGTFNAPIVAPKVATAPRATTSPAIRP